jgi:hypothetical protein
VIGFFMGLYLMARKQPGHGVACLAVSVATGYFWYLILSK